MSTYIIRIHSDDSDFIQARDGMRAALWAAVAELARAVGAKLQRDGALAVRIIDAGAQAGEDRLHDLRDHNPASWRALGPQGRIDDALSFALPHAMRYIFDQNARMMQATADGGDEIMPSGSIPITTDVPITPMVRDGPATISGDIGGDIEAEIDEGDIIIDSAIIDALPHWSAFRSATTIRT
jgi:hypothetical protein